MDGDLQRVGAGAAEVAFGLFADLDRLRAVGLPPGAGERRIDPRREDAEADGDNGPGDENHATVGGCETAKSPDRSESEC